jgi:hypothetical protein
MMYRPDCFQTHVELFADKFRSRLQKKHVMLHIPKAGGTSICQTVQQEGGTRLNTTSGKGKKLLEGRLSPSVVPRSKL